MIPPDRIERAISLLRNNKVQRLGDGLTFRVDGKGGSYNVTLDPPRFVCTCKWGNREWLGNACYHALAAAGYADIDIPLEEEGST